MERENDKAPSGRYSEAWWKFVAGDLQAQRAEEQQLWGDMDDKLLTRYEEGKCTLEEAARVKQAIREFPAVRDYFAIGRHQAAADEAVRSPPGDKPWTKTVRRPDNEPGTSR